MFYSVTTDAPANEPYTDIHNVYNTAEWIKEGTIRIARHMYAVARAVSAEGTVVVSIAGCGGGSGKGVVLAAGGVGLCGDDERDGILWLCGGGRRRDGRRL